MNALTIPKLPNGLTPPLSKSLDSHELDKHRAMVGFELEVLSKKVDRFGWDRDRGSASHDRIVMDWMNALHDFPLDEIQAACSAAVIENPNKMPNEGHVRAQIMKRRAAVVARLPKPVEVNTARPAKPAEEKARSAEYIAKAFRRFGGEA